MILNDGQGSPRDPEVVKAQNRANAETGPFIRDLQPEEDFSDEASAQRRKAVLQGQLAELKRLRGEASELSSQPVSQAPAGGWGGIKPEGRSGSDVARDAAALLAAMGSDQKQAIQYYPSLQKALVEAVVAGSGVTEKDILRVTNYAEARRAATAYINASRLTDADGNNTTQTNILMSANPVQRAAILDVVRTMQSGVEFLETSDTNWLQAGLSWAVSTGLAPFVWANETAQHAARAANWNTQENKDDLEFAVRHMAYGVFSGDAWAATETGQFDETYLQTLRDSGRYTPLAVDIITDISRREAAGDPDPISSTIADPKYASNPEADLIFRGLVYRPDEDENLMELVRQVDSANLGSSGQLAVTLALTPDSSEYSEFRGTKGREVGANATSVALAFLLDPTIGGAKALAAYRAARFALTKLAPGAEGGAAVALRSTKVAGVETNAARKGVQSFVDNLVKYDDLAQRDPAAAATFRTVMARQHKEFPEDVIDEFQKQGIRTVDDFAAFVDETNDVFLLAAGEPSLLAQAGLRAQSSPFAYEPMAYRMGATNVTRRQALMPMSGPVKRLRQKNVQWLSAHFAPKKRGRQTIESFYGNTDDVAQVTERLGDNALDAGRADQELSILPTMPGSGALGRRLDGFTRLFSSLPSVNHIYIADARDAGQFYKLARTFLTRQHATFLTNAFRDGNVAQRRLMVAGLIRTSAAARGVNLSKGEALAGVDALASRAGKGAERYSATKQLRATPEPIATSTAPDVVPAWDGGPALFHGTSNRFADDALLSPDQLPQSQNMMAAGLYTTASREIADTGYTLKGGGSNPATYSLHWKGDKPPVVLDAETPAPEYVRAWIRTQYGNTWLDLSEDSLNLADDATATTADIIRAFRSDMANGGITRADADEMIQDLNYAMQNNGVDALKHVGGKGDKPKHDVFIWLDTANLEARYAEPAAARTPALTPEQAVEDTIQYRPSNFDGEEHALHLWQTSNAVAIPSIKDFEALKSYRGMRPFSWGDGFLLATPQVVTDIWSAYTLAGLRFSVRSAVEDLWLYTVTAGRLPFLYMGRRASTALREARPSTAWKREKVNPERGPFSAKGAPVKDADGNATVVVKSRLGMFASRSRRAADRRAARSADRRADAMARTGVDPGARLADQLNVFFLQNLDEDMVLSAQAAFKAGDHEPMKKLAIMGINRMRLNGMNDEQVEWIGDLVMTPFGLKYLDEVAETGQYLSKGTLPTADQLVADTASMTAVKVPYPATSAMGDFKDVTGEDWRFGMFWFNALEGIVDHDGPIGKIAVANLYDRQQAVSRIADAIRKDTKFGYMDRFSALYTGRATVEQFAARYYDDVRNMFSGADGGINAKLFERLAPKGEDGVRRVGLHDVDEVTGERSLRITPKGMHNLRKDGHPDIVLGRKELEAPADLTPMLGSPDRLFTWMGEQYARISKEPLFLANYIEQRTLLKGYQQELAARVGDAAAKKTVAKMSADRAYGYVLSYTDNPANRSQLAWKVRNVSRYYRATEDFYRRMQRVAKNNPEAFWKTALTYQVLDDTGFVFTDDNGDKYFAYPGNEMLQEAVTFGFSVIGANFDHMAIDPFMLGGKVKMLAPSTDPNQAIATLMGPMGVIPAKAAFALFPQIRGLERYVVGEYSAQSEWWEAVFPGQVARVLKMLTVDERESVYGDAMKDAMAIAVAEGLIGNKTYQTGEDGLTSTNELLGDQVKDFRLLNKIAMSLVWSKGIMGFLPVPASPQVYEDNVTLFARQHGMDSMRDGVLDLVGVYTKQGSSNPFGDAMAKWWQLNPDGSLMPFTVSKTMQTDNKIDAIADVQSVNGLQQWWKDNKGLYNEFRESALFLAPRTGEFSWGAYDLVTSTLGLRVPKDFDAFAMDVLTADNRAEYFAIDQSYKDDMQALNPAVDAEAIKQLEEKRLSTLKFLRDSDPMLNASLATNFKQMDDNAAVVLDDAKKMTQAMIDRGIATPVSNGIAEAIATYEDYMSYIKGIAGSTDAEDAYKRDLKWRLGYAMTMLAKRDANVEHFINVVLRRLGDFKMIEGEL